MGKSKGVDYYKKVIEDIHGSNICIVDETSFKQSKLKINFTCNIHGTFSQTVKDIIRIRDGKKPKGCPSCASISRKVNLNSPVQNYLDTILVPDYEWISPYQGDNKSYHQIKHITCGNVFNIKPNMFQQGQRCKCLPTSERDKVFKKSDEMYVYVCELKNDKETFIKVGIQQYPRRFKGYKQTCLVKNQLGDVQKVVEQIVFYKFNSQTYKPGNIFSGHTECFNITYKDDITNFVKGITKEKIKDIIIAVDKSL